MGNILFLIGITLLLGPQRTFVFFARKNKWKGTLAFWAGVLLILMRWPLIGFGVELFGIFVLFGVSAGYLRTGCGEICGKRRRGADVVYRSSSRRLQGSRTISRLLDLILRADCRLRETKPVRMSGRTRICPYKTDDLMEWTRWSLGGNRCGKPGTAYGPRDIHAIETQ